MSVEFPPACLAEKPDDPMQECTKPVDHGGRWHGNADAFWLVAQDALHVASDRRANPSKNETRPAR